MIAALINWVSTKILGKARTSSTNSTNSKNKSFPNLFTQSIRHTNRTLASRGVFSKAWYSIN